MQDQNLTIISENSLKSQSASFFRQFSILLVRSYRNSYRNPVHLRNRVLILALVTLVTLCLFYDLGYNYQDTFSKAGFFFFCCASQININYLGTLISIIAERDILRKEYKSKTYGIAAIYFSWVVYELMIMLIFSLIFKSVNYFGANLANSFENFSVFIIVFALLNVSW